MQFIASADMHQAFSTGSGIECDGDLPLTLNLPLLTLAQQTHSLLIVPV